MKKIQTFTKPYKQKPYINNQKQQKTENKYNSNYQNPTKPQFNNQNNKNTE